MITVTPQAAVQIRKSAGASSAQNQFLRLAARLDDNGKFDYGMGWDERRENDLHFTSGGVGILVASNCKDLLMGAVLDFVDLSPGESQFIVVNPNDPSHTAKAPVAADD